MPSTYYYLQRYSESGIAFYWTGSRWTCDYDSAYFMGDKDSAEAERQGIMNKPFAQPEVYIKGVRIDG